MTLTMIVVVFRCGHRGSGIYRFGPPEPGDRAEIDDGLRWYRQRDCPHCEGFADRRGESLAGRSGDDPEPMPHG